MNMEALSFKNDEREGHLTVIHSEQTEPLRKCVQDAMQRYFNHLDGHGASNLYRMVMNEVEAPLLESVMQYTNGNQTSAATLLGISRSTLRKKLSLYDLD